MSDSQQRAKSHLPFEAEREVQRYQNKKHYEGALRFTGDLISEGRAHCSRTH